MQYNHNKYNECIMYIKFNFYFVKNNCTQQKISRARVMNIITMIFIIFSN